MATHTLAKMHKRQQWAPSSSSVRHQYQPITHNGNGYQYRRGGNERMEWAGAAAMEEQLKSTSKTPFLLIGLRSTLVIVAFAAVLTMAFVVVGGGIFADEETTKMPYRHSVKAFVKWLLRHTDTPEAPTAAYWNSLSALQQHVYTVQQAQLPSTIISYTLAVLSASGFTVANDVTIPAFNNSECVVTIDFHDGMTMETPPTNSTAPISPYGPGLQLFGTCAKTMAWTNITIANPPFETSTANGDLTLYQVVSPFDLTSIVQNGSIGVIAARKSDDSNKFTALPYDFPVVSIRSVFASELQPNKTIAKWTQTRTDFTETTPSTVVRMRQFAPPRALAIALICYVPKQSATDGPSYFASLAAVTSVMDALRREHATWASTVGVYLIEASAAGREKGMEAVASQIYATNVKIVEVSGIGGMNSNTELIASSTGTWGETAQKRLKERYTVRYPVVSRSALVKENTLLLRGSTNPAVISLEATEIAVSVLMDVMQMLRTWTQKM